GRGSDAKRFRPRAVALVVEQTRAEEQVGGRAEDGDGAAVRQSVRLALRQMDAVAEQGTLAEQPVMFVDVGVIARPWVEFPGESDLGMVLRKMRLHVQVWKLMHERTGHLHLLGRGGDREARRDRIELTALAMPVADQRLRVVVAALRRVENAIRRVA